ncbi:hypothetical protein CL657_04735 [bacterium]|nr:hypothetical protein [bacterium]
MKFKLNHPYNSLLIDIANVLNNQGHKLYLVGGTIRDALMGQVSHDIDMATSAMPNELELLFDDTLAIGKMYGTISIVKYFEQKRIPIQVTTFRQDGDYSNYRHPDTVTFSSSLKDDIQRRDFTINGLAYDVLTNELIDYVSGKNDINNKIIRVIGDPDKRFSEDSLRLLRCCRFIAQLGFACEEKTWDAVCRLSPKALLPSKERMTTELLALIQSKQPSLGINALNDSGLGDRFLPGISSIDQKELTKLDSLAGNMRLAFLIKDLDLDLVFKKIRLKKQEEEWIKALIKFDFDSKKVTFQKKDLALSGAQIKALGYKDKQIGILQRYCLDYVLHDLDLNNRKDLESYIAKISKELNF